MKAAGKLTAERIGGAPVCQGTTLRRTRSYTSSAVSRGVCRGSGLANACYLLRIRTIFVVATVLTFGTRVGTLNDVPSHRLSMG